MKRLLILAALALALAGTAQGHTTYCKHGSITWFSGNTQLAEVFNFHPSAGKHNVTTWVWSRTSQAWFVVHRHPARMCPH